MAGLKWTYSSILRILVYFSLLVQFVGAKKGFDRDVCLQTLRDSIENGTLERNSSVFYRDERGVTMSDPENPVLTVIGCEEICGKSFKWYDDIGPRLSIWLIPVFLLLSNMEVSPLDKRRYLMLIHLLGDPIDSLYCLLLKLEAWSRCYHVATNMCKGNGRQARHVATVLGGLEEIVGFYIDPEVVYRAITERDGKSRRSNEMKHHIANAALKLADSRTDERLRTLLATVLYIYQLVSAFVTAVGGGNSSPPGGRIGIAVFMTWIIPNVLVSNFMGCFTSRRTCFNILDEFVRAIDPKTNLWNELRNTDTDIEKYDSVDEFFDSLPWSGAIYSYRPSKRLKFSSNRHDRSTVLILLLALAPTVISSIIGSLILWHTPPIGLNCRNFLLFAIIIVVFGSFLFTWATYDVCWKGAKHWHRILIKDAIVAIPCVVLIFLATSGLFNSCKVLTPSPGNTAADIVNF